MIAKLIGYLKLLRPLNLLMIIYVQVIIKFVLFSETDITTTLSKGQFMLLVIATLLIAAAGNVINDIYDVSIDQINRPKRVVIGKLISEKAAYSYYILLNVLGVFLGFYLANSIGKPGLAGIFIVISALLYTYATSIKNGLLFGNLLISALVAMSLLIVVLFDIYPAISFEVSPTQLQVSKVVLLYAGFAFFINLIREMVKDLEDMDGDKNGGRNTLPIALGRKRTTSIVFVLGIIALVAILVYANINARQITTTALLYFIFGVGAPLLYFCIQAWNAASKKDFTRLSTILKIIMVLGIASLFFISETTLAS